MEAGGSRHIPHRSRSDVFTIWDIADVHYGNRAAAIDRLQKDIDLIRDDPYSFWFGGGDYAEYIGLTDRRFDPDAVADTISIRDMGRLGKVLTTEVKRLFWPIRRKCLGLIEGNHEKHYERHTEQSHLHAWLCTELEVPNLQYCALIDLIFSRQATRAKPRLVSHAPGPGSTSERFRVFLHHGAGYAQTPGGKLNRLVQFMDSFDAHIYFCAHVHDAIAKRLVRIGADAKCQHLIEVNRVGMVTGTYLKSYEQGVTTYAEQRGYRPVPLGAVAVRIKPDTRAISPVL